MSYEKEQGEAPEENLQPEDPSAQEDLRPPEEDSDAPDNTGNTVLSDI